jgi:hypothetical protein
VISEYLAQGRCPSFEATQFENYGLESGTFSFQLLNLDVVCVASCSNNHLPSSSSRRHYIATLEGLGSRKVSFVDLGTRICEIGHHFREVGRVICSLAFGVFSFQFHVFETEILLLVKPNPCC